MRLTTPKINKTERRINGLYFKHGVLFCFILPDGNVASCRDDVLRYMSMNPANRLEFGIAFESSGHARNSIRLIKAVEKHFHITPSRIIQGRGKNSHCVVIRPNKEWMTTPLRSSFLTFLVKNGRTYDGASLRDWFINDPDMDEYDDNAYGYDSIYRFQVKKNMVTLLTRRKKLRPMEEWEWDAYEVTEEGIGFMETDIDGVN